MGCEPGAAHSALSRLPLLAPLAGGLGRTRFGCHTDDFSWAVRLWAPAGLRLNGTSTLWLALGGTCARGSGQVALHGGRWWCACSRAGQPGPESDGKRGIQHSALAETASVDADPSLAGFVDVRCGICRMRRS